VLLSIGYRLGPERFWSLALALYLPYPVHLLPALGGILISFALGGLALARLLGLRCAVAGDGLELHAGDAAQGRRPVRVLTYNVKAYLASTARRLRAARRRRSAGTARPRRAAGRQ
jgi:hypothetical protein